MNECNLNINLLNIHQHNFNNHNIPIHNINRISIHHRNNTLIQGGVEISEAEDNNKEEEDLVEEEARSYVITVVNQDTFLEIVQVLRRHVHTVKNLTTLLNCVRN